MRNIADQLLILPVILELFLRVLLEAQTHLLKILAELADLVIRLHIQGEFQITVPNLLCRLLQFIEGAQNRTVYPDSHHDAGDHKYGYAQKHNLPHHGLHLRHQFVHVGDDKCASPLIIGKGEVHLLDQVLAFPVQINAAFQLILHRIKFEKLPAESLAGRIILIPAVNNLIPLSDNQVGIMFVKLCIYCVQIPGFLVFFRFLIQHLPNIALGPLCQAVKNLHGIAPQGEEIHLLGKPILL